MTSRFVSRSLLLASALAAVSFAQTTIQDAAPARVAVTGVLSGTAGGFAVPFPGRAVTGKPYSAEQDSQTVKTLADGTHITEGAQKVVMYRDSLGRTRTERTPAQMPGILAAAPPVFIDITDPVAGYRYTLDSNSHIAHRSPYAPTRIGTPVPNPLPSPPPPPLPLPPPSAANTPDQRPRPEVRRESLGTQNIEGVLAEGMRTTTTWPVDSVGNDRPIVAVNEIWTSRDLGMPVLSKVSDPRFGETITKLTNISLSEPDPFLFQPPAGYEIVDPQQR
jgi:hypothetical protein